MYMEFAQLESFIVVLIAICGFIISLSGACAVVVKFWRYAHKDSEKNSVDIDTFKQWFASDKRRIEDLEKRQDRTEEMNKLQLKALVTLLSHVIDGNHTQPLKDVRDEIHSFLIEGKVKS